MSSTPLSDHLRRRLLRALAGAATAVGLIATTACGQAAAPSAATSESATASPSAEAVAQTITVTDDVKRTVEIQLPVERAVVLNSYGNEFVNAIGAGDRVVGTDRTSQNRLPYLGFTDDQIVAEGLTEINYEAVVALEPDVVILPRNASWEDAAAQLGQFDIPVVVATAWDYAAFHSTVELLGQVFELPDGAKQLTDFYDGIFALVAKKVEGLEPVRVYWETTQPFLTVLPGSGFHAIIEAAGGVNVFEDFSVGASNDGEATVDPVDVIERDPEVFVYEFEPSATPTGDKTFDDIAAEIGARKGFDQISAVRDSRVYISNGWATSAVAKAIGAVYLGSWLHPEAFSDVDPESYLRTWVEDFQKTTFNGESDYIRNAAD